MPYFRPVLQLQMDGNRISEEITFKQPIIIHSNGGQVLCVCVCFRVFSPGPYSSSTMPVSRMGRFLQFGVGISEYSIIDFQNVILESWNRKYFLYFIKTGI